MAAQARNWLTQKGDPEEYLLRFCQSAGILRLRTPSVFSPTMSNEAADVKKLPSTQSGTDELATLLACGHDAEFPAA